jgi:cytochrome c oxidase subunit III
VSQSSHSAVSSPPAGEVVVSQFPVPPPLPPEKRPRPGQCGMLTFLCSEVAFFSTLIVAYLVFFGRDGEPGGLGGPQPADVLSLPLVCCTTLCLLYSSVTIHFAHRSLRRHRFSSFNGLLAGTIGLGIIFLIGTGYEWYELIFRHQLTISRNLFGTTFYTLIGFHALHVTMGVIVMSLLLILSIRYPPTLAFASPERAKGPWNNTSVELVSWYWHFVDGVWIVVFTVVYLMPLWA